jgi:hypothetical protein
MVNVYEINDEESLEAQLAAMHVEDEDDFTTDDEEYEQPASPKGRFAALFTVPKRFQALGRRIWSASGILMQVLGKAAWIITTSALLIGLPLLYAYDREKSLVEYEKEQQRFAPPVKS